MSKKLVLVALLVTVLLLALAVTSYAATQEGSEIASRFSVVHGEGGAEAPNSRFGVVHGEDEEQVIATRFAVVHGEGGDEAPDSRFGVVGG